MSSGATAGGGGDIDIGRIAGSGADDPFAAGGLKGSSKIHIRVQQRNGRKSITTIQGLDADLDLKRICKAMKRVFNCNGSIEEDKEMGEIIQLQGDQRDNARSWLLDNEIVAKTDAELVVVHGF